MKTLKRILLIASPVFAALLWVTRSEYLDSLSAFALSDNLVFYNLMHVSMLSFFMLNAQDYYRFNKNFILELLVGFGFGMILSFDMYNNLILHDIFTVGTMLLAGFTLIRNSNGFETHVMWALSSIAVVVFLLGFFISTIHHLLAEIIAISALSIGKLREINR